MILTFRHKGLERLFRNDDGRGIRPDLVQRIHRILAVLHTATSPREIPSAFRTHPLRGDRWGYWAISVNANWRIVFRFEGSDVRDVELIDYH